jgi:hypothetical protein
MGAFSLYARSSVPGFGERKKELTMMKSLRRLLARLRSSSNARLRKGASVSGPTERAHG